MIDIPDSEKKETPVQIDGENQENRLKRLPVDPAIFMDMFKVGSGFECYDGLPTGAIFKGFAIDSQTNNIILFIYHQSFPPVPAASPVPLHEPIKFKRIQGEPMSPENKQMESISFGVAWMFIAAAVISTIVAIAAIVGAFGDKVF